MQIKKCAGVIVITGMLVVGTSAYSTGQSSDSNESGQEKDVTTKVYTIIKGDTLWDISGEFLNNPFHWPDIWESNDYIRNPDLIYPGNKLIIPPVIISEPETAVEEKPLSAIEATIQEQTILQDGEGLGAPELPAEPSHPRKPLIPLAPYAPKHAISSATIEASGYVINNVESYGEIKGSIENRHIYAEGDVVNLSLANRHASGVALGQTFTIFRTSGPIIHPKTRKKTGLLFIPIGLIEIDRVQGKDASGRILRSYNYASIGDHIQPYTPAVPVDEIRKASEEIQGYIIEAQEGSALSAQYSIVYLDKGATDGITPGTILYVLRADKKEIIGELHVVSVQNNTSTALVTKSVEPFGTGSKVTTTVR